jgi:hypothetical protein
MRRFGHLGPRFAAVLAGLLLLAPCAAAEEILTDIVLVIDVSGSMRELDVGDGRKITFTELKRRLQEFLRAGLPLNSTVHVITFGDDARRHARVEVKDGRDRDKLLRAVAGLEPGGWTYMARGLELALEDLADLKKRFPKHQRLLFLITDGKNEPPPHVRDQVTFEDLRRRLRGRLQLKPGEDFWVWYAHFGDASPEVQQEINDWRPERKPFTGDWRIGRLSFNRTLLRLPPQLPGDWAQEFPCPADRARESLLLEGYNCAGLEVRLGPVELPGLPAGARVEVKPARIRLTEAAQPVVLTFRGSRVPPGRYTGKVLLQAPRGFVIPSPAYFHLDLEVAEPVLTVAPGEELDLGGLTLGQAATGRLRLLPNEAARLLAPAVNVAIELSNLPRGLRLEARPPQAAAGGGLGVEVTAALEPPHEARPGTLQGNLTLTADNPFVKLDPPRVPMKLRLESRRVALREATVAVRVEEGQKEIRLVVHFDAGSLPPDGLRLSLGAPRRGDGAPPLHLKQTEFEVTAGRPQVLLEATVGPEAGTAPQRWSYEIPLHCPDAMLTLEPRSLTLELIPPVVVRPQALRIALHEFSLLRGGKGDLGVRVDTTALPRDARLNVAVGPPKPVTVNAPPLDVGPRECVLGPDSPELRLRVPLPDGLPNGVWRYRVPLRSGDSRYYFDPGEITLAVVGDTEGTQPAFLTSRTRVWPFAYRLQMPAELGRVRPMELTFEFRLPDQDWMAGSVQAEEHNPATLRLQPPECLPPLAAMTPGLRPVQYRLRHQDTDVRTWAVLVRVVPPHLERLKFFRSTQDSEEPVAPREGTLEATGPVPLALAPQERLAPELRPHWQPRERVLLVVHRDRELAAGPPDAQKLAAWRKRVAERKNTEDFEVHVLPGDGTALALPQPASQDEARESLVIAAYRYPDGAEEWTDAYRLVPARLFPWLGLAMGAAALLFALALGCAARGRATIPPIDSLKIELHTRQDRLAFAPSRGNGVTGAVATEPASPLDALRRWFLPWRLARVEVMPDRRVIASEDTRQQLRRRLWLVARGSGLYLTERQSRDRQPVLGQPAVFLGPYTARQSAPVEIVLGWPKKRGKPAPVPAVNVTAQLTAAWVPTPQPAGWLRRLREALRRRPRHGP